MMDCFEKAHVIKKQPSKINSKSKKQVKMHLKQMLYGYKNSDNELIKSSADKDVHQDFDDDSTSISGYTDLTNSEDETDRSQATTSREFGDATSINSVESSVIGQVQDASINRTLSTSDILKSVEGTFEETQDSISESNEGLESFSDDIDISENFSSASSDDVAFTNTSTSTEVCCNDSDEFDHDGSLASKILQKLRHKDMSNKKPKMETVSKITKEGELKNKKTNIKDYDIEIVNLNINSENIEKVQANDDSEDMVCTNQSSPFISISASDMNNQSLSEILGNYKHPTVTNLPSEKQNIVTSSYNSFDIADTEMLVEDVDSLTPELGDEEMIDLDLEADLNTDVPIEDTITAYDTMQSESEKELSTDEEYIYTINVFYGNNCCILVLKHPTELYINGKVKIRPLGGTVEVFGYILKDEVELYAPNNNYAYCIKPVENINAYCGLFGKLTAAGLTVIEAEEIVNTIGEYDGVIAMSPLKDRKIDFVENISVADLFKRPTKNIDNHLRKASLMLGCSLYMLRPKRAFEENESWGEAISYGLGDHSRGIVCGGKGVGKSTFLRYYVNRMLENGPILVIDLDPGQAEFTVAGNISATVVTKPLLGPNFTHLKRPDIMLNIGMINVMDNIVRYATAVHDVIAYCRKKPAYKSMPWIINTMGMSNNMGLKLITIAILHAQPTFLLQIDSQNFKKRFDCRLEPHIITQLYNEEFKNDKLFRGVVLPDYLEYNYVLASHVEGSDKRNSSFSPKDERYLNFLAYFGELMYVHCHMDVLGIVPYEVKLSDLNIVTNVKVPPDTVAKVINGKIVGLSQRAASDRRVFTLDDKPLICYGHGLVRGVDFVKGTLYFITPTPAQLLGSVNVLLYADWTPELEGQERHLPAGIPVPYRTTTAQQHKQLMLSPRRRFNPLQLLKMTRST